jgi:heterotetrameric sarcosine oxidase delta subunit
MIEIPCPWCGPRGEQEFHFSGEPKVRPIPAEDVSDAAWAHYLYHRTNAKGPVLELWSHAAGCGRWFVVERDTITHQVMATRAPS